MAALAGTADVSRKLVHVLFVLILFTQFQRPLLDNMSIPTCEKVIVLQMAQELSKPAITSDGSGKTKPSRSVSLTPELTFRQITSLAKELTIVNILILCNDVALNPGPMAKKTCNACFKTIRKNQAEANCSECSCIYHLKCIGADFETTRTCSLCSPPSPSLDSNISISDNEIIPPLLNISMNRGLKCIYQNIRSLSGKVDELRVVINDSKSGIHIIAITETWLDKKIEDAEVDIPGYKIYRKDRDADGGGVAVYVRNDLSVIRREDLEDPNLEGLWLEITLPKSRGFLLGLYYRPPDSSDYLDGDFMARFTDVAELASSEGKEILLVGDFNCDFSAKRLTSGCKQLKSLFRTLSVTQLIDSPTRITKDTSTLLDLIATNCPQNISKSGVISSGFSDHEIIFFIRKINWKRFPAQMKTFRNYANYDHQNSLKI